MVFVYDGLFLSCGEMMLEDFENWVIVYIAGWDKFFFGVFFGEWGLSDFWLFLVFMELSLDFNNILRMLLWMYEINVVIGEVKC